MNFNKPFTVRKKKFLAKNFLNESISISMFMTVNVEDPNESPTWGIEVEGNVWELEDEFMVRMLFNKINAEILIEDMVNLSSVLSLVSDMFSRLKRGK